MEQFIRASRAQELGLLSLLQNEEPRDPRQNGDGATSTDPAAPAVQRDIAGGSWMGWKISTGWCHRAWDGRRRARSPSSTDHRDMSGEAPETAIVLKGYPRLSETFIAKEIHALEQRGLAMLIVSLRHPTDAASHPVHDEISAPVLYLPEYLYQEPRRVFFTHGEKCASVRTIAKTVRTWLRDLRRDITPNRVRRFWPGVGIGARIAGQHPASARSFPAYAGIGGTLCGAADRSSVVGVGARGRRVDNAALGARRKARFRGLGGDLHTGQSGLSTEN